MLIVRRAAKKAKQNVLDACARGMDGIVVCACGYVRLCVCPAVLLFGARGGVG